MTLHPQLLQLATLFDAVDDATVWIKDRDGCYRWVNRAFLVSFSMTRAAVEGHARLDDLLGKTDYDLSPPFLADQFRLDDEQVLAGKRIVNRIELVGGTDDAPGVWNVTNKIPLADADGAVIGTAGITRPLVGASEGLIPGTAFGPVLAHIKDHYHDHAEVTNRQLARVAHMSVRAFERKFRAVFHLTPQKYLRKLQMRTASRSLVATTRPLAEVALDCGFVDQSHFSREFRKYFGQTPRDYRAHYTRAVAVAVTIVAAGGQSPHAPSR